MRTITVEHETDTAHRLSCHKGKCANLHGHRYKFVVSIEAVDSIEGEHFVDFYDLKKQVRELLDNLFDHRTMLKDCEANNNLKFVLREMGCVILLFNFEPTVEAMVDWLSLKLNRLPGLEGRLVQLTIYETPTNYCTWTRVKDCRCLELAKEREVQE